MSQQRPEQQRQGLVDIAQCKALIASPIGSRILGGGVVVDQRSDARRPVLGRPLRLGSRLQAALKAGFPVGTISWVYIIDISGNHIANWLHSTGVFLRFTSQESSDIFDTGQAKIVVETPI